MSWLYLWRRSRNSHYLYKQQVINTFIQLEAEGGPDSKLDDHINKLENELNILGGNIKDCKEAEAATGKAKD
jgi:hypothetical protein